MNKTEGYEPTFTWTQLQSAVAAERKKARAEALEEAAKWLKESGLIGSNDCAEAIRGMK